jgi:hypothetical protein
MNMMITYFTHDNGGRPFKVVIDNTNINVYNQSELLLELSTNNTNDIFIGKSPLNEMTEFSGGYGPNFDGNSILIKKDEKNEYLFIGNRIFTFTSLYPIIEFVSPVGNNDVPYPYAIDEKGNYYILNENIIVINKEEKEEEKKEEKEKKEDIYQYYYDNLKLPNCKFHFSTEPDQTYDWLHNVNFTKEQFIQMCNDYGTKMGFVKLPIKLIIDRLV